MIYTQDQETIIAQCTPRGSGAIALLRMSGENTFDIAQAISKLSGNKLLAEQASHTVQAGWVVDQVGKPIDQVMFIVMKGPRTFTGQDTVEITCHNNQFIIEEIIQAAVKAGARLAQAGEFTRRAFLHKKIDLPQAEAIHELITAQTQHALKKSLAQLSGSFSHWINYIEQKLIRALAWCEASFEFLDDEAEFGVQIREHLKKISQEITEAKKNFNAQQHIRQGIRIALIGSVNAGKSSLFNMLLRQKRSIVTAIAGTTRDSIEATLYRNGNFWTLIDTAGIRQTEDIIEQEGIRRSLEEAHKADLVVLVIDISRETTVEELNFYTNVLTNHEHKLLVVFNKADLPEQKLELVCKNPIRVSGLTGHNHDALEAALEAKIQTLFAHLDSPFLLNQRQHALLATLEKKLHEIIAMLESTIQYELVSYHMRDALEQLSELTGKTISEAGMDMVFKEFCVGK